MKPRLFLIISLAIFLAAALTHPALQAQKSEYKLQSTDVLRITVHEQDDLATKTRVTADGSISFPLIGKIKVSGLTVREVESKIKELLEKDYLVSAQVLVFIEEYHPRQVSVIGEVNSPGKYNMPDEKDITVLEAIAMAGGFTKDADVNNTRIIRITDEKKETLIIKVKDITERGEKQKDIVVQPEDIIFVPESFF